jgi:hypothetical protein
VSLIFPDINSGVPTSAINVGAPVFALVWLIVFGLQILFVLRGLPIFQKLIKQTIHYSNCVLYKIKAGFIAYCLVLLLIIFTFSYVKTDATSGIKVRGTTLLLMVLGGFILLKGKYFCAS